MPVVVKRVDCIDKIVFFAFAASETPDLAAVETVQPIGCTDP